MGEGDRIPDHQGRLAHRDSQSLDKAMATLDRRREAWVGLAPRVNVKIEFLRKLDGYDFTKNPYAKKVHPGMPLRDIFVVSEHLSVTLSFVANVLVLLVFVRVLGTARLPSRIIVSIACANLVSSVAVAVHALSLSSPGLTDNEDWCRFIGFFAIECFVLWYASLCSALVERIVAVCLPSFYSRGQHILGPALLASPWAFWTLNMLLLHADIFKFNEIDAGYECNSHLNYVFLHESIHAMPYCVLTMLIFLVCGLSITMLLQNQTSGDVWEINRMQFEIRTTAMMIKLVLSSLAFTAPLVLVLQIVRKDGVDYTELQVIHGATQVSLYKGLALLLVLLTRQEFRRQLVMVFESSETIRRTRTTNLLVAHGAGAARTYPPSRQPLPQSSGGNVREAGDSGESIPGRRQPTMQIPQAPAQLLHTALHGEQALVGRDKLAQVHTPKWLLKEEKDCPTQEDQGHLATLYNRTVSMLVVPKEESDA